MERHRFSCRRCVAVTCVDCNVRFGLDAYSAHTSCVSEAQKYEKTVYRDRPAKRDPQAEWVAVVSTAAAAGGEYSRLLGSLANFSNVPRKIKPFIAFAKNSLRVFDEKRLTGLFTFIQSHMPPRPGAASSAESADDATAAPEAEADGDGAAEPSERGSGKKRQRNDEVAESEARPFSARRFIETQLVGAKKTRLKRRKLAAAFAAAASAAGVDVDFDKTLAKLVSKERVQIMTIKDCEYAVFAGDS